MPKFFHATTPIEGSDGKTRFVRVGVAFPGRDGSKATMQIRLDALPTNGQIVLFEPTAAVVNVEAEATT
jgi:hypothetical protein